MIEKTHRLRVAVSAGLVGLMGIAGPAAAETLTGTVSSQTEGLMEGVVVSAKKQGGTISVAVVSNAEGRYQFPDDRLSAGTYDVVIRAVGYALPDTSVTIGAGQTAELDLRLDEVTDKVQLCLLYTSDAADE